MPSLTVPPAPRHIAPPTTQEKLDYADLAVIDLSEAQDAKGRAESAIQVSEALRTHGFFTVINHGYTSSQIERMFDVADVPFSGVDSEEKQLYTAKMEEAGSYQGYKPRQYWVIFIVNSFSFQIIITSALNRDVTKRQHPEAVRPFLSEIEAFARHTHFNVLHPILSYPRSQTEELKTKNVWLKGHTDIGSISVLYSRPVSALQILGQDGKWKWVKHIENGLVINAGDTLEFISGGYYKATIHRVVQPPVNQRNFTRLGFFYFCMPDDDVKLVPFANSPVLQRVGIVRRCDDADAPMMEAWRRGRTSAYGNTQLKASDEDKVEEEVINGMVVKHYN
ncbi:hypothetical protein B0H13DRAFT_2234343 [Mycena leptocephala]|nr:hypothetical protein B0H13DRAFT_2234343 [Mycena leptocephala]